ncbi:MAG: hypothetical protein P8P98_08095, partial [Emcibacteraceae bacterium]|nr:hypothetical protein [Emcibacteraceae bacterium]
VTLIILMVIVTGIAILFSLRLADSEQEREAVVLQNHMATVLNGRVDAVSKWVTLHNDGMAALADNQTIQLFMSTNNENFGLTENGNEALLSYIFPLLNDRANQMGFLPLEQRLPINANIKQNGQAGLALTNATGQILMATSDMPAVLPVVSTYVEKGAGQGPIMIGPLLGESGLSTVAFITPVFSMTGDNQTSGFLIGIKPLKEVFYNLLEQPGEMNGTAQNRLVYMRGNEVQFMQNEPDLLAPVDSSLLDRASAFAMQNPGRFASKRDEKGEKVFMNSREVRGTDWILMRLLNANEAFADVQSRIRNMIIIMVLSVIALTSMIILIWRHGVSVRLKAAFEKEKELSKQVETLNTFMKVVTNSQPTEIAAVDDQGKYTFVNTRAAEAAKSKADDMIGKTPSAINGRAKSKMDELHIGEILEGEKHLTKIRYFGKDEALKAFKMDYIAFNANPSDKGVLVVKEDISSLEKNRIKRELGLKSLISTLTMIIGSRDPFSRTHSERVVLVTNMLSEELCVDENTKVTAELAGAMMNLGKILVSREILTKPGKLSNDELKIIRNSILKSADMIKGIEFE